MSVLRMCLYIYSKLNYIFMLLDIYSPTECTHIVIKIHFFQLIKCINISSYKCSHILWLIFTTNPKKGKGVTKFTSGPFLNTFFFLHRKIMKLEKKKKLGI